MVVLERGGVGGWIAKWEGEVESGEWRAMSKVSAGGGRLAEMRWWGEGYESLRIMKRHCFRWGGRVRFGLALIPGRPSVRIDAC